MASCTVTIQRIHVRQLTVLADGLKRKRSKASGTQQSRNLSLFADTPCSDYRLESVFFCGGMHDSTCVLLTAVRTLGRPVVNKYFVFALNDSVCQREKDKYVAWVQCSKEKCGKWRRLEDNVDPATLPDDWVCSQNPDPLYNMCDLPEEVWDGRENDIIYAELVPGSIVWAKQFGYPWWPGMVEHDPQTGKYFMFTTNSDQFPSKYNITFFDTTVSHAWIPVPLIKSFQEIPQERNMAKRDFSKRVNSAKKMAEEAQKDRISQFGFIVRYKGIEGAKLSEDSSSQESLEDPCIVKDAKRPASRYKEETRSKDCAKKEPENHQLTVRKGKGKNGIIYIDIFTVYGKT
ncbi:hypothetical protein chiPu_0019642 [Chiloscyllium punctatum]|uniref:PWWP domain-containing protein n=1 Tax=Chiloscyllium punctatum TaxID=137246 RepID=A0A401RSP7_CHIPU|nr:hypothetical protein [Chiloscyllium punctatum]